MMNINEKGRSMIEMLGVLAIIGVISVGGLQVINRMQNEQKHTKMVSELADFARYAKKMACQYDDGYSDYNVYLYKSNAYPSSWTYDSKNTKFTGVMNTTYSIAKTDQDFLQITAGNLSDDACMRLVTSNWGSPESTGFYAIFINNTETEITGLVGYDVAEAKCNKGLLNTVYFVYYGCH